MLHCLRWIVCLCEKKWSARQIVKGYFHSMLRVLKRHFHAQSENVKGEFEVLVRGCEQIFVFCFFVIPGGDGRKAGRGRDRSDR